MTPQNSDAVGNHEPDPPALDDFLSSLAHDLRSPVGVIEEALRALSTDLAPQLTDEHRLLVTLAKRSVLRLLRTADTVNILAGLGAGAITPVKRPCDLVEILRAAAANAATLEPRREVRLSVELPDSPVNVAVDPALISRAISEVVINALRHAWRHVHLRLEIVESSARDAGEVRAIVEDDGQGVAPERRATLFDRFAPTPSRSGLGVGLSIAHDVIVGHGGEIALEASSLRGRPGTTGARFVLSLPTRSGAAIRAREVPSGAPGALRVLLVDDHEDGSQLLGLLLSGRGFEVTIATSKATAIAAYAGGAIDALVSDLCLGGESGNDLLRQLRGTGPRRVPAIAVSGLDGAADLRAAREAGFDDHLTKPVNVEVLVDALRRVTGA